MQGYILCKIGRGGGGGGLAAEGLGKKIRRGKKKGKLHKRPGKRP